MCISLYCHLTTFKCVYIRAFFSCFFFLFWYLLPFFFNFFYLLLQMELHLESKVFLIIAEHYTRTELIFMQFDAHFFTCFHVFYNFAFKPLGLKWETDYLMCIPQYCKLTTHKCVYIRV